MILGFKPGFHVYMAGADCRTVVWVLKLCRIVSWHQHFKEILWLHILVMECWSRSWSSSFW